MVLRLRGRTWRVPVGPGDPGALCAFALTLRITAIATIVNTIFGVAFALVLVRVKENQLDLFGERLSCAGFAANEVRLLLATFAHLLIERFRAIGLKGTELAQATACTIRQKLFKIAALVEISIRVVPGAPGLRLPPPAAFRQRASPASRLGRRHRLKLRPRMPLTQLSLNDRKSPR